MALSETMSAPNDWLQFYHQNFPTGQAVPSSVSDATLIPTTMATATAPAASSPPPGLPNSTSSTSTLLGPEGRVSKPIRRRSRASRRTPTTLLTTDTTNFRAMVQQFTGGPAAPFAPTASMAAAAAAAATSGLPNLGFGFGSRQALVNPTGLVVGPPGYHLQQQQQLYQPPQNQQFMYNSNTEGGDNNTFFQRLSGNPRPRNVIDRGGEFLMDNHGGRFLPK